MVIFETLFLFMLLIVILVIKPSMLLDLTSSAFGKVVFLILVIYFSYKSTSLGLLFTIFVVVSTEMITRENFTEKINVIADNNEPDKLNIEENLKSKESNSIHVNKIQDMDNVTPLINEDKINVSGYISNNSKLKMKMLTKSI